MLMSGLWRKWLVTGLLGMLAAFFADRQFALLWGYWCLMWAVCMPKRPVNRLQAAWVYNTGMSMMWAEGKYCAKCLHRYW